MSDPNQLSQRAQEIAKELGLDLNRNTYPDTNCRIHTDPRSALNENMRVEDDYSRSASGGCNQDPERVSSGSK